MGVLASGRLELPAELAPSKVGTGATTAALPTRSANSGHPTTIRRGVGKARARGAAGTGAWTSRLLTTGTADPRSRRPRPISATVRRPNCGGYA